MCIHSGDSDLCEELHRCGRMFPLALCVTQVSHMHSAILPNGLKLAAESEPASDEVSDSMTDSLMLPSLPEMTIAR